MSSSDGTAGQGAARPGPGDAGPSRRIFLSGTAAAVGALVWRSPVPVRAASLAAASGAAGFTFVQAGPKQNGTRKVDLTMTVGSSLGSLLVATIVSSDAATPFAPPAGWRLANAVRCAAPAGGTAPGRVEIWYYPGTPASPGSPAGIGTNTNPATFTSSQAANCFGAMVEFSPPPNAAICVLDAEGLATDVSGTSFSVATAGGNVAGDLGIAAAADFFDTSVPVGAAWTVSQQGWTQQRQLSTGTTVWAAWRDLSLPVGPQSLTASFADSTGHAPGGQQGWALALAAFRAVVFQPLHLDGAEMATMVTIDPTGQELILGGDVEGLWRTADFGDHWQLSQDGLYGQKWRFTACVAWSLLEQDTVYACVGENAAKGDGGFLVSTDGGVTWSLRSAQVQFQGNAAGSPPLPAGEMQTNDRSTGDLLAQDPVNRFLYAATYHGGIARSPVSGDTATVGTHWESAGFGGGSYYARTLVINPANPSELFAGFWDWDPGSNPQFGGVWHTTKAPTATQTSDWSPMAGFPTSTGPVTGTVADLKIIGGYLYAACPTLGIFRHQLGVSGWTSLNGGPVSTAGGQLWTSLDGYVDQASQDHVIIAACGNGVKGSNNYTNVVRITIAPDGTVTPVDLTGSATIDLQKMPPGDQTWWRYNTSFANWLGGSAFVNPHVLIDTNIPSRVYLAGSGGFYRTMNAGADPASVEWTIASNGMPMSSAFVIAVDPGNPSHVVLASADFTQTDLTDPTGWDTSTVTSVVMPDSHTESHAIAFDPASNIFTGVNTKYGQNAGGAVYWRLPDASNFTWHDTGYNAALAKALKVSSAAVNAPMGIFAGVNGNIPYIVVVTQGADVWRAIPAESTMQQPWTWTQLSTGIGTAGNIAQHCPIIGDQAGNLYCFDRVQGLYRSADHGKAHTWTQIWDITTANPSVSVSDERSGWLALNPHAAGELWLSASTGLYKLTSADTGASVSNGIGLTTFASPFPNGAGGIAFTSTGQPYVPALSGPLPTASPLTSATLQTTTDGSTWQDAAGDSFGSYASWPKCAALAATTTGQTIIIVASDSNWAIYGTPTT